MLAVKTLDLMKILTEHKATLLIFSDPRVFDLAKPKTSDISAVQRSKIELLALIFKAALRNKMLGV